MDNQKEYEEAVARAMSLDRVTAKTVLRAVTHDTIGEQPNKGSSLQTSCMLYNLVEEAKFEAWNRVRELANERIRNV